MIEQHNIQGRAVWLQVEAHPMNRENRNIIPTEYFTATYYLSDPNGNGGEGRLLTDENGEARLFESPVAALSFLQQQLEKDMIRS